MGRHGKSKTKIHPRGIKLHLRIYKLFNFSEGNDLIELMLNLFLPHPHNRAVKEDILAARQFRMETSPNFQERANASVDFGASACRFCDTRKDLEQRAFAGTV